MKNVKKVIMILFVLFALIVPVLAQQSMSVSWKWNHDDQDVSYYRYQLNSESEEGWTVVPNTVLSFEATELDPYSSYTLYLQCSYDGENWSESAVAVAEPLLVAPPVEEVAVAEAPVEEAKVEAVVEEVAVAEPVEVIEAEPVAEPEAVVEPAPVAKAEKKAKTPYSYKTNLLITTGAATDVTFDKFALNGAYPRVGLALEFQNIVHAGQWGLGLRFDIDSVIMPSEQDWNKFDIKNLWFDSSADAKLMMYLGNEKFDYFLGGGVGYSIFNPRLQGSAQDEYGHSLGDLGIFSTAWFASANTGMRIRFNDVFSLGVEANYRYLMPAKKHSASADLVFGFTF